MLWGGGVVAVGGILATWLLSEHVNAQIVAGGIAIGGLCYWVAALSGVVLLRRAIRAAAEHGRRMELSTYLYRGVKSMTNDRVLSTLDDIGSKERTPLMEFKARWFTPGIAESPSSEADVYGGMEKGQAVLAVTEYGGVLGRVSRMRRTP
jgi:hypothetical protein